MLRLKNIVKNYTSGSETVEALKGVSLDFRSSEFVSILGQSGCGKTTLLNIMGGLDRATDGDLLIDGISTRKYKDRDWDSYRNHSIGFVFQSYYLIPHQNILRNVELALTLAGVSSKERRQRALEALDKVGLRDKAKKRPNELSGGQMQRVAIARAIVNNPDIILADEPTGALDTSTSIQVMDILKEISKDRLVIMVTHNPTLAEQYSTRIIRMLDGKVTEDTNPLSHEELVAEEQKEFEKSRAKVRKPSMKFSTAFKLSLKNLIAKKGRTILTAFAGSIGIIGIALIYSVSNGTNDYIARVQEETLTSYPITLEAKYTDMGGLIAALSQNTEPEEHEMDAVYQNSTMRNLVNSFNSVDASSNDLDSFAVELEKADLGDNISAIHYSYDITPVVYTKDTDGNIIRSDSTELFYDIVEEGIGIDMRSISSVGSGFVTGGSIASAMATSSEMWQEMIPGRDGEPVGELFTSQYDVIYGHLPTSYDEVVLVLDDTNGLSELALYALGFKSTDEMSEAVTAAATKEKVDTTEMKWSYEEIAGAELKLLLPGSAYEFDQESGTWKELGLEQQYANAQSLKISAIVRRAEDSATSASGMSGGTILYTNMLTAKLTDLIEDSDAVKWQMEHPTTDMFTGLEFPTDEQTLSVEEKAAWVMQYYSQMMAAMGTDAMAALSAGWYDISAEQIASQYDALNPSTDATYEGNLELLGYKADRTLSSISIYTSTFAGKDVILDFIQQYNDSVDEASRIDYTDYVGLIMSSVTSIINAVTYVLVAFVAVSLVVSSIMIAVITLISVQERTKEIGILRSLGASKRNVSSMFNAETVIIGLFSGIMGIAFTYAADAVINVILHKVTGLTSLSAVLPPVTAGILVCVSFLLTLVSGIIPSGSASRKDPVTALRSE